MSAQRETFESLLSKHTGLTVKEIHELCYNDTRLTPKEAIEKGFVDKIVRK